jgi:hypothetical protein
MQPFRAEGGLNPRRRSFQLRSLALPLMGLAFACLTQDVQAQFQNSRYGASQYSYRTNINGIIQSRPTVSPYVSLGLNGALTNSGFGASFSTYQTFVRPQLEQRERAMAQQRQYLQLQEQVSGLRNDFELNLQRNGVSTGHPTRFMTHSHYYPKLDQPRR